MTDRHRHYNDHYDTEPWQNNVNLDAHNRLMEQIMSGVVCGICLTGTNNATTPKCDRAGCPAKRTVDSQIHRYGRQQTELVAGTPVAEADDRTVQEVSGAAESQGLCDTTLTERFVLNPCLCITYAGNLGPCKTFLAGGLGYCVYCHHRIECHNAVR